MIIYPSIMDIKTAIEKFLDITELAETASEIPNRNRNVVMFTNTYGGLNSIFPNNYNNRNYNNPNTYDYNNYHSNYNYYNYNNYNKNNGYNHSNIIIIIIIIIEIFIIIIIITLLITEK